ncbi:hypothetical protein ACLOJK_030108 [Asimina triloba]
MMLQFELFDVAHHVMLLHGSAPFNEAAAVVINGDAQFLWGRRYACCAMAGALLLFMEIT